ncbi:uncharacterized protein LOC141610629 isoform X1 [Silene latifolia]|uniref:uncharacterized protein LOC141610629 isoform X1 n=1 Tax=Silene latifolia TaxID=37657 RepID=UPI003D7713D5
MLHRHIQSIIRKDGRNYVMSAEIAMAREMTFKNKLQKLSMESSSSTDPLHYQCCSNLIKVRIDTAKKMVRGISSARTWKPRFCKKTSRQNRLILQKTAGKDHQTKQRVRHLADELKK